MLYIAFLDLYNFGGKTSFDKKKENKYEQMVRDNTLDQLFLVNTRKGTKMKPEYTKIQKIES